jgi:hypothetical protein
MFKSIKVGFIIGIGLTLIIAFAPSSSSTPKKGDATAAEAAEANRKAFTFADARLKWIHGMVTYRDFVITIKNLDTFDWINPEFDAAPVGDASFARFFYRAALLRKGETIHVPVAQWSNAKGEDMPGVNPKTGVVTVHCKVADGSNGVRRGLFGSRYDLLGKDNDPEGIALASAAMNQAFDDLSRGLPFTGK